MQSIPMRTAITLLAVLAALLLAACAAPPAPIISTPRAPLLPTPAAMADAALTNLRPLTTSGSARFGVWMPNGHGLVFAESDRPLLPILLLSNLPKVVTKEASLDGSAVPTLGEGFPLFFSPDGRTLYLNRELAGEGMGGLWAIDRANGTMRRAVEGLGGMVAHQLSDGRIVVAENGTYAPLRVYDPATGALAELTDWATLASLPAATARPMPSPTPPLSLPPAT